MLSRAAWLLAGMLLGMMLWANLVRVFPHPAPVKDPLPPPRPASLTVNPTDPLGIVHTLATARPGDTVEVPAGEFLGPIQLKEGVSLTGKTPGQTILRSPDGGVAILARGIRNARVTGLRIVGDEAHPLLTGVLVNGSAVTGRELRDRVGDDAEPVLRLSYVSAAALKAFATPAPER